VQWITAGDGNWGDQQNWDLTPPGIPGAGDDVTLDVSGTNVVVVTIKQDVFTVNSLLSNEALIVESGGLVVAADSVVNGPFTLYGIGTLGGAGNLTLNGPSLWSDATTMDAGGRTIVGTTGTLSITPGTFTKTLKRTIENRGATTFTTDSIFSSIALYDALFDNKAGATFTVAGGANSFFYGVSGTNAFANAGTFAKSGSGTATFGGPGSGPVVFTNSGTMTVGGGAVVLQAGATHTGSFTIAAGATLQLEGGHHLAAGAALGGAGTVVFRNGGANLLEAPVAVTGEVRVEGGSTTFNGPFAAGTLNVPIAASVTFNGASTVGGGQIVNTAIGGGGDLTFTGGVTWAGYGSMSGSGRTTVGPAVTLDLLAGGAPKEIRRLLVNDGTVNWGGSGVVAALHLIDGTVSNRAGATFNAGGDDYAIHGAGGANRFLNAGLFDKTGSGELAFTGASGTSVVTLVNTGTVSVSAGLLRFDGAVTNAGQIGLAGGTVTLSLGIDNTAGTVAVGAGGVLNLGGTITRAQLGTFTNAGGEVNLLGTLDNTAASLALNDDTGALRFLTASALVGGTLSTAGSARAEIVGAATFDAVSLSGPVTLFQQSNLTVLNGLTLGNGPLRLDAPGTTATTVLLQGSQTLGGAGTLTTLGPVGGTASVAVSAGATLTVGPNVTVTPGTRDLFLGGAGATIVNHGTMLASGAGRLLTVSGSAVQNLGTFQVADGATLAVTGAFANVLPGGELTGGAYLVSGGGTLRLPISQPVTTNSATVHLDGATSTVLLGGGSNFAFANLARNTPTGDFMVTGGRSLTSANDFANAGKLTIGPGSQWTTAGLFSGSGTTTASGTLTTGKTTYDGAFTLAGGTHTVSADFVVGQTKASARYDLSGGRLTVNGFATVGAGPAGAAVFDQSAGTFAVGKQLYVSTAGTNTSTFNLAAGTVTAGDLFVGFFGGSKGVFNHAGGAVTLTANPAVGSTGLLTLGYSSLTSTAGVYNLSGGALTHQGAQIGFAGSADAFNHGGGTHTISGAGLQLAMFTGATATYAMSNGANLVVTAGGSTVGAYGNGVFDQTGGTHTVAGTLHVGRYAGSHGTYHLAGGTLTADVVRLTRGLFNLAGGTLSTGHFLQEGGDVTGTLRNDTLFTHAGGSFGGRLINAGTVALDANLTVQVGIENLTQFAVASNRAVIANGPGLTNDGTFTLAGGLTATSVRVGQSASATFTQTGGTNTVGADLLIGVGAGQNGAYALQAGKVAVAGNTTIGVAGAGTFDQTGGLHTTGALAIGQSAGATGAYTLAGGTLTANTIDLLRGTFNQAGGTLNYATFNHAGGTVTGTLTNTGTYAYTAGAFDARMVNSGTVTVNADLTITGGLDNRAAFAVPTGRAVTVNVGATNDGSISLAGTLTVNGDHLVGSTGPGVLTQTAGQHTVSGTMTLGLTPASSGTVTLSGGTLTAGAIRLLRGRFEQAGGTLTATHFTQSGGEVAGVFRNAGTFAYDGGAFTGRMVNTGTVVLNSDLTLGGGFDNAAPFSLAGGRTLTVGGAGLVNESSVTLGGGNLTVNGDSVIGSTGHGVLAQTGGLHTVSGTMTLGLGALASGTVTLAGGTLTAALINIVRGRLEQTGGTLDAAHLMLNGGELAGVVQNAGTFTYNAGLFTGRLVNSGTVILNADLTLGNGLDNRGTFDVASNRAVVLSGPGLSNDGLVTLAGSLTVPGDAAIGVTGAGSVTQTAGTHAVGGTMTLGLSPGASGVYNLSGGTLTAGAIHLVRGTFNQTGGVLAPAAFVQTGGDVTGILTNAGAYTYSGGTFTGRLLNTGTVTLNADFTAAGGLEHRAALTVAADRTVTLGGPGLINDGQIQLGGALAVTNDAVIGSTAAGAVTQSGGAFTVGGTMTLGLNPGSTGTYTLGGGTLTASAIHLSRGALNLAGGTLTYNTLTQAGGDITGTLNNATTYTYAGGTLTGRLVNTGTVNVNADLALPAGFDNAAGFALAADRTLTVGGTGLTNDGAIALAGNLTVTGDHVVGATGPASLTQTGGNHAVSGTMTLGLAPAASGTVTLAGGTLTAAVLRVGRGKFEQTGGTLAAASLIQDGGELAGTIQNAGTFTHNSGPFTGRLVNSGTVVLNADLTLGNGLDNRAPLTIAANRAVTLNGQGLANDAALALAGGTLTVNGDAVVGQATAGAIDHTAGVHAVSGTLTLGSPSGPAGVYTLAGGTLTAGAIVLNRGTLHLAGGALNYATLTQAGGDVTGTLDNAAAFTYAGGTFSARLVNTGTVAVNADLTIAAGLDNRAAFAVPAGRAVTLPGTGLLNTGTLAQSGTLTAAVTVNHGTLAQAAGSSALHHVSGTGTLSVSGGTLAATTIRQRSLAVSNDGLVTLATGGGGVSVVNSLVVSTGSGTAAAIDVGNNALIVDYAAGDPTPFADARALAATGYAATAAAHWTGPGLRSSAAAADPTLGVAVAEASEALRISGTQTATFLGQTVDASAVLVRVTKLGDTNLNGVVDFGDFQRFERGFDQPGARWYTGDFNHDSVVDAADFAVLLRHYGQSVPGAPAPAVTAAELTALAAFANTVPEPATAATLALAAGVTMLRRTRRSGGGATRLPQGR
jgi:hypothetical protein